MGILRSNYIHGHVAGLPQNEGRAGRSCSGNDQILGGPFTCKNELKGASEVVRSYKESLLALEKEKEYADLERDCVKLTWKMPRLGCKSKRGR